MTINALNTQTTVQRNEAPSAAAEAPSASTVALVVERERILGEQAEVKLTEADTVALKNRRWELQAGMHNGMSRKELNRIGAELDEINRRLGSNG